MANIFVPHPVKEQLPGVDFCLTSNPSWPVAIIMGFQHYVVMLGTTVIIPSIIVPLMGGGNREKAEVIQTLLFVAGLNTLLQTLFGTRLPVVIGPSYTFVVPAVFIVLANRYNVYIDPHDRFIRSMRGIQGALMIASIFPILAGFLGIWRLFVRLLSPLSAVPLITLVGLGLYTHGFPQLAQCIEIGLPELIILVILSQYLPHYFKSKGGIFERFYERYAVLLSIAIVWPYAALLTAAGAYKNSPPNTQFSCRVDRSGLISGAPWIRFPYPWQWGTPTVNAGEAFVMVAAAIVALIESTGAFKAASRYASATPPPPSVLSRGAGWLGIGIMLDGLFGAVSGSTALVENVGLLALTRVGSRRVVQISAGFMLFFSVLGKFGAVLASIPLPIFGALYCLLFAYTASAGLSLLQFCNLNSFRTKFIIGFSIFLGFSVPQYFNGYVITSGHGPVHTNSAWLNLIMEIIFTSPATVAVIVAIFLDHTVARSHASTRLDSGRHWWEKFRYFNKDPRSEEFYALPLGLTRHFPSV
ncbi:Nucleobase-ascorbate transporter like [Actinidia chinensis var. chinensis]|uniref:Nucleobase-ascorbate transporter like n=1 Tax=Actinidia chinensis var. chinensis TaxID=1590841 RepID=A0A2R6Q5U1_ACTCC|nr:Nucleobase-ascorbate transporter like [Actinidia chinensis var. chinensis]